MKQGQNLMCGGIGDLPMKKRFITRNAHRSRVSARIHVILRQRIPEQHSKRIPIMTKVVEAKLYKYAPSIESYSDLSTLERRVTALARAVILFEQMNKQGSAPKQQQNGSLSSRAVKAEPRQVTPPKTQANTGSRRSVDENQNAKDAPASKETSAPSVEAEKKPTISTIPSFPVKDLLSIPVLSKTKGIMGQKNASSRRSLLRLMANTPSSVSMMDSLKNRSFKGQSKLATPRHSVRDILSGNAPALPSHGAPENKSGDPAAVLETLESALTV